MTLKFHPRKARVMCSPKLKFLVGPVDFSILPPLKTRGKHTALGLKPVTASRGHTSLSHQHLLLLAL